MKPSIITILSALLSIQAAATTYLAGSAFVVDSKSSQELFLHFISVGEEAHEAVGKLTCVQNQDQDQDQSYILTLQLSQTANNYTEEAVTFFEEEAEEFIHPKTFKDKNSCQLFWARFGRVNSTEVLLELDLASKSFHLK